MQEVKACRCTLCGEMIVTESQDDCITHMETCSAFNRVHPRSGETNPNGVYPDGRGPSSRAADEVGNDDTKKSNTSGSNANRHLDVDQMTMKELKHLISSAGLSCADCIEKDDILLRAREALSK